MWITPTIFIQMIEIEFFPEYGTRDTLSASPAGGAIVSRTPLLSLSHITLNISDLVGKDRFNDTIAQVVKHQWNVLGLL